MEKIRFGKQTKLFAGIGGIISGLVAVSAMSSALSIVMMIKHEITLGLGIPVALSPLVALLASFIFHKMVTRSGYYKTWLPFIYVRGQST